MPLWPKDYDGALVDHRLDPYRDRAAVVSDNGEPAMQVFIQVDLERKQTAGHLWWRRWSHPREFVVLHMLMCDGVQTDSWLSDEVLGDELDDWSQGRFMWDGKPMRIDWCDATKSEALRNELGLDER
ncbi:hypothetical protein [Terrabacter tumescens]|nr:hypothetical protein [Terrabacter tumescens]